MTVDPLWQHGVQVYPHVTERGLSGFDFQALNRRYIAQPANDAAKYGVSIRPAPAGVAFRCIGVHHLAPSENRGKHNVYLEVLDEQGRRIKSSVVKWTWYMDAPIQTLRLDKSDNEPAGDIPMQANYTVTVNVDGGVPSDSVSNLHTRHPDEKGAGGELWNSWGHHSFYLVFQRRGGVIIPPDPVEPTTLEKRVAALERQVKALQQHIFSQMGDGK